MAGIIFFKTQHLAQIQEFYVSQLGMTMWLNQGGCIILKHGNLLLGFCEREEIENAGVITLFYESRQEVDAMYQKMQAQALGAPQMNETYRIYQFFAKDPEGRTLEFQAFLHSLDAYEAGDDLLMTRRSIRKFEDTIIPDETLWKLFELCRYAPTSHNSQPYYFVVIKDRNKLEFLSRLRGKSSTPIAKAPIAVAICADPESSKRHLQDGCIAAYHFVLAAKLLGLGTCWIAAMDREDAKRALDIPQSHYIATITPLGYPAETPNTPSRKPASDIVRVVE